MRAVGPAMLAAAERSLSADHHPPAHAGSSQMQHLSSGFERATHSSLYVASRPPFESVLHSDYEAVA